MHQFRVCLRKRQFAEPRTLDPLHLLSKHRLRLAFKTATIEMQLDRAIGVKVSHPKDACADVRDNVELFEELAAKRLIVRLMRQAFPPGELPVVFEMCSCGAKRQQEALVAFDHGSDDDNGRHSGSVVLKSSGPAWNGA